MKFSLESFYNPHIALGGNRLDAVLTISAETESGAPVVSHARKAVAYIIDTSGSMGGDKLAQAKLAVRRAIDLLDEDCLFTVIGFDTEARVAVPLSPANAAGKATAHSQVQRLNAGGGTAMSRGLLAALEQLRHAGSGVIAYAQFLTDGDNASEMHRDLEQAVERCKGQFQCDCWGVGVDWKPSELRFIAGGLLGSADAVPDPDKLEQHFQTALKRAISRGVGDVRLRLQLPKTCRILSVKQMSPEIVDLSGARVTVDDKNSDYPLGAWAAESRDYHVAIELEPQPEGEELMAFRPKVVVVQDGVEQLVDGQRVIAAWTADTALSTRLNQQVAHYTGQEELASSIKEGLEAKARGDLDQATVLLGRATKLAVESGNEEVTQRLKKVVDVVDASAGTVRLRSGANKGAELELDMGGTRTVRKRSTTPTT